MVCMRIVKRYGLYGFSGIKINIANYITNISFSGTLKTIVCRVL